MKTNVTYTNQNYFVNRQKNTVCCVLDFSIKLNSLPFIDTLIYNNRFFDLVNNCSDYEIKNINYDEVNFTTTGIAKCSAGDKFDETLGRKIALTRAQQEAFAIAKNFYNEIVKIIDEMANEYAMLAQKSAVSNRKCKLHVNELINNV